MTTADENTIDALLAKLTEQETAIVSALVAAAEQAGETEGFALEPTEQKFGLPDLRFGLPDIRGRIADAYVYVEPDID